MFIIFLYAFFYFNISLLHIKPFYKYFRLYTINITFLLLTLLLFPLFSFIKQFLYYLILINFKGEFIFKI